MCFWYLQQTRWFGGCRESREVWIVVWEASSEQKKPVLWGKCHTFRALFQNILLNTQLIKFLDIPVHCVDYGFWGLKCSRWWIGLPSLWFASALLKTRTPWRFSESWKHVPSLQPKWEHCTSYSIWVDLCSLMSSVIEGDFHQVSRSSPRSPNLSKFTIWW